MRKMLPWVSALVVLTALWPTTCSSSEGGPTTCESLLLPLPWGDSADTWGIAADVVAAVIVYLVLRTLLRRRRH